jgi:hypothetical protein
VLLNNKKEQENGRQKDGKVAISIVAITAMFSVF